MFDAILIRDKNTRNRIQKMLDGKSNLIGSCPWASNFSFTKGPQIYLGTIKNAYCKSCRKIMNVPKEIFHCPCHYYTFIFGKEIFDVLRELNFKL